MQSYGDFHLKTIKNIFFAREAYGAYTKFAAETAMLAITVAKHDVRDIGGQGY